MAPKTVMIRLGLFTLFFLAGCSSAQIPLILKIDTPPYHVTTGNKMLEWYKIESARREFDRALELDPKNVEAFIGLGLADAYHGEFKSAMERLGNADRFARGRDQEIAVHVGYMRFYTIAGRRWNDEWLRMVEENFDKSLKIGAEFPAPYYYMGLAYRSAGQLDQAAKKFYRVMELGQAYSKEADLEYAGIENRR